MKLAMTIHFLRSTDVVKDFEGIREKTNGR